MLRYYGHIRTSLGRLIRLEIHNSAYGGVAEELVISADSLTIDQNREGRFGAICSAGWTIVVESDTDFKFQPMLLDGDLDNSCRIYENGELLFSGWLENGVAEEEYVAPPYDVQLAFNDGLKKLKGYYLNPTGMWDKGYYNFIELFRICLSPIMQANKQGKKMLYINNSLYNDAFKQDLAWSCFEQIYLHASAFDGDKILLYDLLENLLKPAICYIAQVDGDWYIERVKNKIHAGSVDYHAFDLTTAYDIVNNRGVIKHVDGLNYGLGYNMHEFNATPTLSTEKEYGIMNIDVDNTMRDNILSARYSELRRIDMAGPTTPYSFTPLSIGRVNRATYTWYCSNKIGGGADIVFTPIESKYDMAKGIEFTHTAANGYLNHIFTQSPCHLPSGGKASLKFNLYVDIKQDTIEKKTWVIVPFEFMSYEYVNTTNLPNGGKLTFYNGYMSGGSPVAAVNSRWQSGPISSAGTCFYVFNSDDNSDVFTKWYAGQSVEVSIDFTIYSRMEVGGRPEPAPDMPYLMLFTPLFCDGNYNPVCDSSKIVKSAYGDISLSISDGEKLEDGYSIDKTTGGEYVAKREAPSFQLKYWEGPPIIELSGYGSSAIWKTFVNFNYKNLIYVPSFTDVINVNAAGEVIGIKTVDGGGLNVKVSNSQNYVWHDRKKPIGVYNKKGFLLERIAQDCFDCYYKASGVLSVVLHTATRPRFTNTFYVKHLPNRLFVATTIKQMVDADEYEIVLEEIRDEAIETELFLPRVKSKTVTNQ